MEVYKFSGVEAFRWIAAADISVSETLSLISTPRSNQEKVLSATPSLNIARYASGENIKNTAETFFAAYPLRRTTWLLLSYPQ